MDGSIKHLSNYQSKGLAQLYKEPIRRMVRWPYGSGKSLLGIRHAQQMQSTSPARSIGALMMVLCKTRNVTTWERTIAKYVPSCPIVTSEDSPRPFQNGIILVPHSRLGDHLGCIMRWIKIAQPSLLFFDETTKIKNPDAGISQYAKQITEFAESCGCHILGVTGRAMPESPKEIWSQFNVLYPTNHPFQTTYYQFLNRWFVKSDHNYALNILKEDSFHSVVDNHSITFDDADWLEFEMMLNTENRYAMEYYEPSSEQEKLLAYLDTNWALPYDPSEFDSIRDDEFNYVMSIAMKRQQIMGGFYYRSDKSICFLKENPKLDLLIEAIRECLEEDKARKIVVWRHFSVEDRLILDRLVKLKIKSVVGPKAGALNEFADNANCNVIIMPASVSEGFNELVSADRAFFYSNVYSSEARGQAEARIVRLGQKASFVVQTDLCAADAIDEAIITALQAKNLTKEHLKATVRRRAIK